MREGVDARRDLDARPRLPISLLQTCTLSSCHGAPKNHPSAHAPDTAVSKAVRPIRLHRRTNRFQNRTGSGYLEACGVRTIRGVRKVEPVRATREPSTGRTPEGWTWAVTAGLGVHRCIVLPLSRTGAVRAARDDDAADTYTPSPDSVAPLGRGATLSTCVSFLHPRMRDDHEDPPGTSQG